MRRKKQKSTRKIVKYYKVTHGFREPYKVLLDGNFLHAMIQIGHDRIEDNIESLLGAKVKLFVPSCAFRELQSLAASDKSLKDTLKVARMFPRHKDGCVPEMSSTDSLLKQVGTSWRQGLLMYLDKVITAMAREPHMVSVPLIYASTSGLHLLPPQEANFFAQQQGAQELMEMPKHELRQLQVDVKQSGHRRAPKKAKGPNPLAVKKSSKHKKSSNDLSQSR